MSQTGLVRAAGGHTLALTESGVIETTAGSTEFLPPVITTAAAAFAWVVKNAATGSIASATGTAGLIDSFVGGIASSTDTVAADAEATYIPDTNLVDFVKV